MTTQSNTRRGFTLLETAAVIGMVSLLAGVMMPAVQRARTDMRGAGSAANLVLIGQGSAMYAQDNQGRLFTYTWEPGLHEMPDGKLRVSFDVGGAADWQQTAILMRRTGRLEGPDRIQRFSRLPHRRYSHLVLMDYMATPFPSPLFADPADENLLRWQADPLDVTLENNIPYAPGYDADGYDDPGGWTTVGVRQRWAFATSYQRAPAAWNTDGLNGEGTYVPVPDTPHLFAEFNGGPQNLPAGRLESEVWFPSAKVHMFEEFDREQAGNPYFAYDHARPEKLMFDGSVNDFASGEANPSWNPANGKQEWRQTYVPIHTFPIPLGGLGDQTLLSQRYRWTLGGLKGIDYAAPLMGRPAKR